MIALWKQRYATSLREDQKVILIGCSTLLNQKNIIWLRAKLWTGMIVINLIIQK